jgi:hypothetical protein
MLARPVLYRCCEQSRSTTIEGNSMNIHKHMEAIFVTTLAIVGAGSFVIDRLPDAQANVLQQSIPVENNIGTEGHMAVIVVRGHRLPRGA